MASGFMYRPAAMTPTVSLISTFTCEHHQRRASHQEPCLRIENSGCTGAVREDEMGYNRDGAIS